MGPSNAALEQSFKEFLQEKLPATVRCYLLGFLESTGNVALQGGKMSARHSRTERMYFQNPNTGWPMTLTWKPALILDNDAPHVSVAAGDEKLHPSEDDVLDAEIFTDAVYDCDTLADAVAVLKKQFHCDF